ncbi:hypothetical protein FV139_17445 [Parahaliea maris]|uniref:Cytochrome c domain-containing protein n=1 Tax=Parahaliea maris TaxID=2716870 RepID=A0A5C8ZQK0_9GAMM|nr:di-heme-cytochrome C peroxidase [Parahaliea maris]TXS90763.1 hypothetical protein FV139_17445 [Parahaliea maris]
MTTVNSRLLYRWFKGLLWLLLVLALIALVSWLRGPSFGAVIEGLTPPHLPKVDYSGKQRVWPQQNWDAPLRQKYHHISQGTRTLPIPLSWLLALERPVDNLLTLPFGKRGKFSDDDYLLRFGFIGSERSEHNPHGLPVGFAATPSQNLPGVSGQVTAVGFNCAACHTSHFTYGDTEYIIEGGPATTDLGQLTSALGAALGQTLLSSKVPLVKGRFYRFADAVLGEDAATDANISQLAKDLESLVEYLAGLPAAVDTVEGFTRLDALNRIGNQVFALDPGKFENYVPINAPVNYPHIWTSSWFSWVQYDGSIMNPLVRNTGEAMGVSAYLDTRSPHEERRFSSSVKVDNLYWIEQSLSGTNPLPEQRFNGLLSPPWPESLPAVDRALAQTGAALYREHCEACHLPAPDSERFWSHFNPVEYYVNDERRETEQALLSVHIIPHAQVGTDPAQGEVLVSRTVNTAGMGNSNGFSNFRGMGVGTEVCTRAPGMPPNPYRPGYPDDRSAPPSRQAGKLVNVAVSDGPNLSFALALGAVVQQVNNEWFLQNYYSAAQQALFEEGRPNCLQAGQGYKARPLNGVWATAPFLHNGSVPTVMALLSPPDERPCFVELGGIEFDPVHLGLAQDIELACGEEAPAKYGRNGRFILDTSVPGNSNRGHEFSSRYDATKSWWDQPMGVIGPELEESERLAIIEYLKTL